VSKILFVVPIIREDDCARHIPYGLALMASLADQLGHQVQVFDANAWRPGDEVLRDVLEADRWDVVATGGITTAYAYLKKTVEFARRYAPSATVVVGGGVLTSMPRDIMHFLPQVDVGVVGEGFVTWPDVLTQIATGEKRWQDVLGIIWRRNDGSVVMNSSRPLVHDLDAAVPYPAWDFFPLDIYFRNSSVILSEEAMQARRRLDINVSYGCSLICRFCFHLGLTGDLQQVETADGLDVTFTQKRDIRWHSPRYIVDLVKYAKQKFNIDFVAFLDENLMTMNVSTGGTWLPEICDLWIKEGLQPSCIREGVPHDPASCDGVHWGGTSHAALATPAVLRKMREAGCTYLDYGLESFSERLLKTIGKGASPKSNRQCIPMAMAAGIRPIPNQIIGFPDEFFDSILDSLEAWEELGIVAKPFFATPYPGTEWFDVYKERILEQYGGDLEAFILDLGDATRISAVISANFSAVELLGLRELMVNRDFKRIREYEKAWRAVHGEPRFPEAARIAAERETTRRRRAAAEAGAVPMIGLGER
jgi:anaerobic magnesium-protoporphyrin IX monomethyl ester cyclase